MLLTAQTRKILAIVATCGMALFLAGCTFENAPIISTKGPVALAERNMMFRAFGIMMIVVIPVFVMTAWFAWRYRASNTRANYQPNWMSNAVDTVVWIVPALIVASLGFHVWIYTHQYDPYKSLDPSVEPLEVQVIAQDWKWLFVYPEQDIAVVNELAFPSGVPLRLTITSDTVMNSFFIPALGSQIYAMAGMTTQLNLLADEAGEFRGRNTQYSGDGFADQHFAAIALSQDDFDTWVEKAKQSSETLDDTAYAALAKPSIANPVAYYSGVRSGLFDQILLKYECGSVCTVTPEQAAAGN